MEAAKPVESAGAAPATQQPFADLTDRERDVLEMLAAFGAAPYIFPDKRIHLQYTTTSPKLHKVLGVETQVTA